MKLTLIEALCIIHYGWNTDQEKKLYDYAVEMVNRQGKTLHLQYQLFVVNSKLKDLNS